MRFLFYFFIVVMGVSAFSADSDSYMDSLLGEEEEEVNCSNILQFIQSYFDLSEKNHILISVSANRFLSQVERAQVSAPNADEQTTPQTSAEARTDEQITDIALEIADSVELMRINSTILSDKVDIILDALPGCLLPSVTEVSYPATKE